MWKKLLVTSLGACLFSSSMLAKPSKKHKPIEDREKQEQLEKEYQGKKAKSKKGVKGWHKNKKKKNHSECKPRTTKNAG